jgi:hypothetical protein
LVTKILQFVMVACGLSARESARPAGWPSAFPIPGRCREAIGAIEELSTKTRIPPLKGGLPFFHFLVPLGKCAMQTLRNHIRPLPVLLLTAGFLGSLGCGVSEKVVSVAGTVTHNGKPVDGLVVSFVPQAQTQTGVSTGETDEKGKYELTVASTGSSGAVVGTHRVWVSLPREPAEPVDKEERARLRKQKKKATPVAQKQPAEIADILKKYGSLEKTPLRVEVKGGEPIDLNLD